MRMRRVAVALLLAGTACHDAPVAFPEPAAVSVPATRLTMVVGDVNPLGAQVLDQHGRVIPGAAAVLSTDNPSVATVEDDGMVRAVSPGTARVSASYGASTAGVDVTVGPDGRVAVQSFDVLADSVTAHLRAGVQTLSIRAVNGYGAAVCPRLAFASSDISVATARMGGPCQVEVVPAFAGETTITVAAEGRMDTFRVRVTSTGAAAFFSTRPTATQLVAGASVLYTVMVISADGAPIRNQRVNLDVSAGELASSTLTTDSTGMVTAEWRLPTRMRDLGGQNQSITFSADLPSGAVVRRSETVFINGASLVDIALYHALGWDEGRPFFELHGSSAQFNRYTSIFIGASGLDQYGNARVADFTFALTGSMSSLYWWACNGSSGSGIVTPQGIEYTCFATWREGNFTLTVSTATGLQKTLQLQVR